MKIEILLLDNINEKCTGMTCFEAEDYIKKALRDLEGFSGIMIIDNTTVKFSFSCQGMDGDIFSNNDNHRRLVKYLIPIYAYNNQDKFKIGRKR